MVPRGEPTDSLDKLVGILPLCFAAHNLWCLGYPDQAVETIEHALALAHELSNPFGLAMALDYLVGDI